MSPALALAQAPVVAEITGVSAESTGVVPTVKPVLLCPAGTVTVAGTLALAEELERFTAWPPCGAGCVSATVPLTLFPPMTADRDRVMLPTQSAVVGLMVRVAGIGLAEEAVITAAVELLTADVEMGTVAVVSPDGIVTEAGTVAALLLLVKFTSAPLEAGFEVRLTSE